MSLLKRNLKLSYNFAKNILFINKLTFISIVFLTIIIPLAAGYDTFRFTRFFVFLFLFMFARTNMISVIIMSLYSFIQAFILPIGLTYGSIRSGMFFALFETNLTEVTENILNYSWMTYLWCILTILASYYYLHFFYKSRHKTYFSKYKNIFLILFIIIFLISTPGKNIRSVLKEYQSYQAEIQKLKLQLKVKPSWEILSSHKQDKNIIIVIGESVNREYLSLYGYKHDTTPFLKKTNGIFIDGFISPASHTVHSLMRTLAETKNKIDVNLVNNAVTLAKMAGYKTYWVSNQGLLGEHDGVVSQIAMFADNYQFINKTSKDKFFQDDFLLLDKLKDILSKDHSAKIVFLHMYGSHIDACKRLFNFPNNYDLGYGNSLNCYLATINKLDTFIEKINAQLIQANKDYSLIYFSDHGQKMALDQNGTITIHHSDHFRQGYKTPLFLLSPRIQQHTYIKKNLSAFHFLDLFANEIGVETKQTSNTFKFESFPEEQEIKVKTFDKMVDYNTIPDDKIYD